MTSHPNKPHTATTKPESTAPRVDSAPTVRSPFAIMQRIKQGNVPTTPREIHQLQQTIGNAAVTRLLQRHAPSAPKVHTQPPLQRVSEEIAKDQVADSFDEDIFEGVWSLLKVWLSNLSLEWSKVPSAMLVELVYTFRVNLDDTFQEWLVTQKDPKDQAALFPVFLSAMDSSEELHELALKYKLVGHDFKRFDFEEEDEKDEDFEMGQEETSDSEGEMSEDEAEDEVLPDATPDELLAAEETGKRVEELDAQQAKAIEDVGKSDGTFEPVLLDTIRKNKPHLKDYTETNQFETKKKGEDRVQIVRPKDSGVTTILTETFTRPYMTKKTDTARTVLIEAEVVPTATTDRLGAPEPDSGMRVGTSKDVMKTSGATQADAYRNQGFKDAQKGHVIALELGGPDVPRNIVPQWANWQGNGLWRKMETTVLAMAESLKSTSRLQMRVEVHYKADASNTQASFRALAFPSHFTVQVWEIDAKSKAAITGERYQKTLEAAQDHTDYMLMYRQDHALMTAAKEESPYTPEMLKQDKSKKRKATKLDSAIKKPKKIRTKKEKVATAKKVKKVATKSVLS